ncbi:Sau3AI family type II restriction endonuclease [Companilactobacillus insicii]|uniref:Sau3AI family type II restriction endonuclease n=1 Tax=Companilactobacillus insicii TaxID=1732567 RepID=UPI000F77C43B|nr:Sau3AI family type II restriction endonuclease [Companilactobacillus insicii]
MEKIYHSKEEVHNRAREIVGIPFSKIDGYDKVSGNKNMIGDLFEIWFGKEKDSASKPDLGVAELKATPYKKLKNGKYSSKERLVFNIINYMDIVNEDFENSHFLYKNKVIELGFYEYLKDKPKDDWTFTDVAMYEMSKNPIDYAIIKNDWNKIKEYVVDGKAEYLSESLTNYLSACTKGANSKSERNQPYSDNKAKQRAFSLKNGYMTQILRKYILGDEKNDSIIKNHVELNNKSLREIIEDRFKQYVGKTESELRSMFSIDSKSKSVNNLLARGMLGLNNSKSNTKALLNIDEFNKASYKVKTIQFDPEGRNKESMSFPIFKFKDLVNEVWVDDYGTPSADLNVMFSESTFIFVVFQENTFGDNVFKGVKFFNVPQKDIDGDIKNAWQATIDTINRGVELTFKNGEVSNNFIKKDDNKIMHVRPHAAKASYENNSCANELPTPARWTNKPKNYSNNYMTNQCFFLNNDYVKDVVKGLLD